MIAGCRKGFTLVELMIVVAIVGVLAVIALPNFLNYRMKAKSAEAKYSLAAIRSLQIATLTETGEYLTGQDWTPVHGVDKAARLPWDQNTRFSQLGFAPEGRVYFEYRLLPTGSLTSTSFTAEARCDLDNDLNWSIYYISDTSTAVLHSGALY